MRLLSESVLAVHDCPQPVIVKVDGVSVGAGFGLALAGDLLYCSDRARFSAIFAKLALSLDYGTSWFLAQRIGVHKAKELALTGKMVSGVEAAALGLVNAAVPAEELDAAVAEIVGAVAAGPPIALSMTKRQLDNAWGASLAQALEQETLAQSVNVHTADMREALTAVIDYAFGELDLNRIEADTDPRNERSTRLLEHLAFVKEGLFRERCIVDGEVSDSAMYGLLRRDWERRAGSSARGT